MHSSAAGLHVEDSGNLRTPFPSEWTLDARLWQGMLDTRCCGWKTALNDYCFPRACCLYCPRDLTKSGERLRPNGRWWFDMCTFEWAHDEIRELLLLASCTRKSGEPFLECVVLSGLPHNFLFMSDVPEEIFWKLWGSIRSLNGLTVPGELKPLHSPMRIPFQTTFQCESLSQPQRSWSSLICLAVTSHYPFRFVFFRSRLLRSLINGVLKFSMIRRISRLMSPRVTQPSIVRCRLAIAHATPRPLPIG